MKPTSATGPVELWPRPALPGCPECGGTDLQTVHDGELVNFLCADCRCCWHLELGWVHRIDTTSCPGCALQRLCGLEQVPHRRRPARAD